MLSGNQSKTTFLLSLAGLLSAFTFQNNFLTEQKKYERVKTAIREKSQFVSDQLIANNIKTENLNILIKVFKAEQELQIFAKNKSETNFKSLLSYRICQSSGRLGPKRQQGDNQVPEGFYHIEHFNPQSNFYLSLKLNYPNASDRKKSSAKDLGGDIYIHGSCVTIGCMPMTDEKIKEIYLLAIQARQNGQTKIPVYVFPFKMTDQNFNTYKEKYITNPELVQFWTNLKTGFDEFEGNKRELKFSVDKFGNYQFKQLQLF